METGARVRDLQHPGSEQVRLGLHLLDVGHTRLERLEPLAILARPLAAHRAHRRETAVALEPLHLGFGQDLGHAEVLLEESLRLTDVGM